jgi:hypothetical protein
VKAIKITAVDCYYPDRTHSIMLSYHTTRRNWKDQPGLMQHFSDEDADASFLSDDDTSDCEGAERREQIENTFLRASR